MRIEQLEQRTVLSAGMLDPSFSRDGLVFDDLGSWFDEAQAVAVQADGKILAAGSNFATGHTNFAVTRYNIDGSVDTSFGSGGGRSTDFGGREDRAYDMAIQGDGKIVLAGSTQVDGEGDTAVALARYLPDGSLDPSFGSGGKVVTNFSLHREDLAYSVAIQPDGAIIVAGVVNKDRDQNMLVARYLPDGTLDPSFHYDGAVEIGFGREYTVYFTEVQRAPDVALDVAIQKDGGIVVVGWTQSLIDLEDDVAVARLTPEGTLDPSFHDNGMVVFDFPSRFDTLADDATPSLGCSAALQSDGKIIVAGSGLMEIGVARLNPDGRLDPSFSFDGRAETEIGLHAWAQDIAIQSDGKILVTGYADMSLSGDRSHDRAYDFVLVRYRADGSLDTSFDDDGIVITDFSSYNDYAHAMALQDDGRIVVAGTVTSLSTGRDFGLARYLNDLPLVYHGELDLTGSLGDDWMRLEAGPQPGDVALFGVPGVPAGTIISGVDRVRIDGLDGDDRIVVVPSAPIPGFNGFGPRLQVMGGAGNDVIQVRQLVDNAGDPYSMLLDGGSGNDKIALQLGGDGRAVPLPIRVDAQLLGRGGRDTIDVEYTGPQRARLNLRVNAGAGDDAVNIRLTPSVNGGQAGAKVEPPPPRPDATFRVNVLGGAGDDLVGFESIFPDSQLYVRSILRIDGGLGDDAVQTRVVSSAERTDAVMRLFGGSGNDRLDAQLEGRVADSYHANVRLDGGRGNDTIHLGTQFDRSGAASQFDLVFALLGRAGDDRLTIRQTFDEGNN